MTPARGRGPALQPSLWVRGLMPAARHLPRPLVEWTAAGAAVFDGGFLNGRYAAARRWATARGLSGWRRERLAFSLLANHGRYVAEEGLVPDSPDAGAFPQFAIEGGHYITSAASGGVLLLGFHLGPPNTWMALRANGFPVRIAVRLRAAVARRAWQAAHDAGIVVTLPDGSALERAAALHRLRGILAGGGVVAMTGDGAGVELFRIDVPGNPVIVRSGWFSLRRAASAVTLPVLTHADGRRRVVVIHPPLPAPLVDEREDAAQCQRALTPLLTEYVAAYPSQCRWLAIKTGAPHRAGRPREEP